MYIPASTMIITGNHADTKPPLVSILAVVAAIETTVAASDTLPKLTNQLRLMDITAHLVAIEKVRSMDMVTPTIKPITLLH